MLTYAISFFSFTTHLSFRKCKYRLKWQFIYLFFYLFIYLCNFAINYHKDKYIYTT